jgi:phage-related minor tail protein
MAKGKELEAIVAIAGRVDPSLQKSIKQATSHTQGLESALKVAGAVGVAAVTGITAAGVAATKSLIELGGEFDSAYDNIRVGTGATGEALDDLKDSFKDVYSSVPASMEDASQAISDWNTRLGVTDGTLETLSKQALQVSDLMDEDLTGTIETSSQAFKQWKIDAEDMSSEMDYIFKVSQSTGMGFSTIMSHVQSSGAVLQDLGYNFDQAATMIANLDKAGINTEQVLKGMKKGLGNIAKDGGDAVAAMNEYSEAIASAKTESEAITIATDIFGSATAVTMAQAIRTGAMDVDSLTKSLQDNGETISTAAEDTYDFSEKLQIFKQDAQTAFEPFAISLFDALGGLLPYMSEFLDWAMPGIVAGLENIGPLMEDIAGIAEGAFNGVQTVIDKGKDGIEFVEEHEALFEALAVLIGGLTVAIIAFNIASNATSIALGVLNGILAAEAAVSGIATGATAALGTAMAFLTSPVTLVILAIAGLIAVGVLLYKNWDTIAAKAGELWTTVVGFFSGIGTFIGEAFGGAVAGAKANINSIISLVNGAINAINGLGITIPDWVPLLGGKSFQLAIPNIPMLATGGFTNGVSIAGEAGTEAVISFDRAYRDQNISYWAKAGRLLGITDGDLFGIAGNSNGGTTEYNLGGISFSPNVTIKGNASKQDVIDGIRASFEEFTDLLDEYFEGKDRGAYGAGY